MPALFLDMFGDPTTNPKRWPLSTFREVGNLDRGKSRHRPRDAAELYGGPYPFIQTGDVANSKGRITRYSSTYSEAGLAQSKLWPKGTLCITIAANIAKTGVLDFDGCFPDSVVGFLPGKRVSIAYIQGWLFFLQPTLEALAPQAAQKNINLEILRALPIPLPPLHLQIRFEQRCDAILSVCEQQQTAIDKAKATFNALLGQAYSQNERLTEQLEDSIAVA
jgi:type I restriction enzyme S subunit